MSAGKEILQDPQPADERLDQIIEVHLHLFDREMGYAMSDFEMVKFRWVLKLAIIAAQK